MPLGPSCCRVGQQLETSKPYRPCRLASSSQRLRLFAFSSRLMLLGDLVFSTANLISLWAFFSLDDVVLYRIAFLQALVTFGLDGAEVHKHIRSSVSS